MILLILAITGMGIMLNVHTLREALGRSTYARAVASATSLAAGTRDDLLARDVAGLRQAASRLLWKGGGCYIVFTDSGGHTIASAERIPGLLRSVGRLDPGVTLAQWVGQARRIEDNATGTRCLEVVVPIHAELPVESTGATTSNVVGYVRFAADTTENLAQIRATADQLLIETLLVLLMAIPVSVLITRHVVAPINELARTARAIAAGSMDARAPVLSRDEIGELAHAFNVMVHRVAGAQMELLKLNADLEQRVHQRTRELEELASRDPLTGLYNRRHFGEVIAHEFAAAERYDNDLTCLMFDLDHFKEINDHFGHRTGDQILIMLANAISSELRSADVGARFGGDEFVLLMPQSTTASASKLAERIVEAFARQVAQHFPGVNATVSVGVASLQTMRAPSSEALIHEADVALYAAKEAGRNRTIEAQPHVAAS